MLTFTTPQLRDIIKSAAPSDTKDEIAKTVDSIDFLEFGNLEASVNDDVKFLQEHSLVLKETKVTGWIYHTETGAVCSCETFVVRFLTELAIKVTQVV